MKANAPKILIVDDDPHIVALVKAMIERYSEVSPTFSGVESVAQAIACLEAESFDLVISDFQMPECDGLQLVTWLKEHRHRMPVILTSGFADLCAASLFQLGVFAFVAKPFDAASLMRKVKKALASPEERWRTYEGPQLRRVETYINPESGSTHRTIADVLGIGGVIVAVKRQLVMRGDVIQFVVKDSPGSAATIIEGIGTIAWVEDLPPGDNASTVSVMTCGVEFEALEEESRVKVLHLLSKTQPTAFIPYIPLFAERVIFGGIAPVTEAGF